jgi:hypothetical protein
MFRHGIGRLNFPRNQASRAKVSTLPHPPSNNVLRAEGLIDGALAFQNVMEFIFGDFLVEGLINFFEGIVDIIDIFWLTKNYLAWSLPGHRRP